jgi:hypothetical protein
MGFREITHDRASSSGGSCGYRPGDMELDTIVSRHPCVREDGADTLWHPPQIPPPPRKQALTCTEDRDCTFGRDN